MTYQSLIDQLEAIKKEHCPTTPEDWQRFLDTGVACECAICKLTCDLLIAEIQGKKPITDMPGVAQ